MGSTPDDVVLDVLFRGHQSQRFAASRPSRASDRLSELFLRFSIAAGASMPPAAGRQEEEQGRTGAPGDKVEDNERERRTTTSGGGMDAAAQERKAGEASSSNDAAGGEEELEGSFTPRSRQTSAEWMEWPADLKVNLVCERTGELPHAKTKVKAKRHSLTSRGFLPATFQKAEKAIKKPILRATKSISPRLHKERKDESKHGGEQAHDHDEHEGDETIQRTKADGKPGHRIRAKLKSQGSIPASVFEKLGVRQESCNSFVQVIHQGYLFVSKPRSACFPGQRLVRKWFVVTEFGELRFSDSALQADVMKPFFKHIEFQPLAWLGIKDDGELNGMIVSLEPVERSAGTSACLPRDMDDKDALFGFRVTATFERTKRGVRGWCFRSSRVSSSSGTQKKTVVRELYAPNRTCRDHFVAAILQGLSRLHSGGGCGSVASFQELLSYPLASEMLDFQMVEYADRNHINQSGMV